MTKIVNNGQSAPRDRVRRVKHWRMNTKGHVGLAIQESVDCSASQGQIKSIDAGGRHPDMPPILGHHSHFPWPFASQTPSESKNEVDAN
jgi:hypothetical protein